VLHFEEDSNYNKLDISLCAFEGAHRSLELSLIPKQLSVLEHGVGDEVGVDLQLACVPNHVLETLFGLQRRLHELEADRLEEADEAHVLLVIL
jgi:hypothetical protein